MRSILLFCVRFATCLVLLVIGVPLHFMGQTNPSITAFLPDKGKVGDIVTLSGVGFSTVATENVVMFGSTRAEVVTPSATSLTVKVPAGALYGPISVTNLSTGLTSVSRGFFVPTFAGDVSKLGFSDRVDFSADGDVRDLSVGDLDGDGKADLVFGRSGLSLYRNVSTVGSLISSSFSQRVDYYNNKLGLQGDVRSSSIGDLDGDGRPDILATGDNGRVSVLRNVHTGGDFGSSSFAPGVVLPVPGSLEHGFLGDFDGDGRLDVAVVDNAGPYVSILRNKGVPSQLDFDGRLDFPVGSGARNAAVGDLDGDGLPDIVVANNGSRSVSVLRNTSTSSGISFAPGVEIMADDLDLRYIGLADLDGDGRLDMLTANGGSGSVSVFRNVMSSPGPIGVGSFGPRLDFSTGTTNIRLSVGDLDGDGRPDVVMGRSDGEQDSPLALLGNRSVSGSISFAASVSIPTGRRGLSVAVCDFDGDGVPDLGIGSGSPASFSVLRNTNLDVVFPPPAIESVTPASAVPGSSVTVTGQNFSADGGKNVVLFGSARGEVTAATATSLTVTVPVGATHGPVTVTHLGNRLTAMSPKAFLPTFSGTAGVFEHLPRADVGAGSNPYVSVVSDLDGDGKPDLVTANWGGRSVSVLRNASSSGHLHAGSFGSKVDLDAGGSVPAVAVGDLDGDGRPEVVASNYIGGVVSVFPNTSASGSLSFGMRLDLTTGGSQWGVSIADLDGDGKPDIVVANPGRGVTVLRNTSTQGSLTFAARADVGEVPGTPWSLSGGDLDGDGKPDIAVVGNSLTFFRNKSSAGSIGAQSFEKMGGWSGWQAGADPRHVVMSDFDGDGRLDVAVVNRSGNSVSVFMNTSSGTGSVSFADRVDIATGSIPMHASVGDVDGDGKADLAVSNYGSATVSVLRNESTGTGNMGFAAKADLPAGNNPYGVLLADLDGDQRTDMAVVNSGENSVSLIRYWPARPSSCASSSYNPFGSATLNACASSQVLDAQAGYSSYAWSTGATSQTLTVSSSGRYWVRVTDAQGCQAVDEVYVNLEGGCTTLPDNSLTFSPTSAKVGDVVTLSGKGFSTTPTQNIVMFGATRATEVIVSSDIVMQVKVPSGATYGTITLTNNVSKFTTFCQGFFLPTFPGNASQIEFDENVDFQSGNTVESVAVGNLDGDGKADLAMVNGTSKVSVYKNASASGQITPSSFPTKVDFDLPGNGTSVSIGEIDGDGKPDLVITRQNDDKVVVLPNISTPGSLNFSTGVDFNVGDGPSKAIIGDLDMDGKSEIVTVNQQGNSLSVLRNVSGTGAISSNSFETKFDLNTGLEPLNVVIGDIDGDAKPDLAIASNGNRSLSVYRNKYTTGALSSSAFDSKVDLSTGDQDPSSLAVGDLDKDGKLDLVSVNKQSNSLSVFRNKSDRGVIEQGSFESRVDIPTGMANAAVGIGDIDGDGKADLSVVPEGTVSKVTVVFNDSKSGSIGSSSFSRKADIPTRTGTGTGSAAAMGQIGTEATRNESLSSTTKPQTILIGDIDGDGKPDITLANTGTNSLAVLKNDLVSSVGYTWTGAVSQAWNDAGNWNPATVPGNGDIVVLPDSASRQPILDQNREFMELTVGDNVTLDLGTSTLSVKGLSLTIEGNVIGSGKVRMSGTSAQTIYGEGSISNIEVENPDGVTIQSGTGNMLTVTGVLSPTSGKLYTNGRLTLRSDANGTARVGPGSSAGGYIIGDVVTQRHLTVTVGSTRSGRAWRLVTIPVTGDGTLRDFFMAGQDGTDLTVSGNQSAQPSHLGTVIVGHDHANAAAAARAGFDWVGIERQVSSLRRYVANSGGGSFASSQVPVMTTTYSDAAQGYGVFVRGDRKQDYNNAGSVSTTTLQATGQLKQGTQSITIPPVSGIGFVLVGNPFMALLDMEKVMADPENAGVIDNTIHVWDANIDGNEFKQGGYRQVTRTGINTWTSTGAGTNPQYIESGVAFFVKPSAAGGVLKIKESHKVTTGAPGIQPLSVSPDGPSRLFVNLEVRDTGESRRLVDGSVAFFDDRYRDTTDDPVDIRKMTNMGTGSMAWRQQGLRLSMEGRAWPTDTARKAMKLDMRSLGNDDYVIRLIPSVLKREGFSAWLKDGHLEKEVEIDLEKETVYGFRRTGILSVDTGRFEIVYRKAAKIGVATQEPLTPSGKGMRLYPNPSRADDVKLSISGMESGVYRVQVMDMSGRVVASGNLSHNGTDSVHRLPTGRSLPSGRYVVRVVSPKEMRNNLSLVVQ